MAKTTTKDEGLFLPSLRGQIGDWVYYTSLMQMRDIAVRIHCAEEIHKSRKLRNLIQRQLTDRSEAVAEYLRRESQRFFNSLVVGVYGGQPDWYELDIKANDLLPTESIEDAVAGHFGVLRLTGKEKLFAIDGQHRVAGIRDAISDTNRTKLGAEHVCVLFVSHSRTVAGYERTRRLFTTLNRYAKPVTLMEAIALDEDDVAAIVTRNILETKGLMHEDRVAVTKSAALHGSHRNAITNITSLYKAHDTFLGRTMKPKEWRAYKLKRPASDTISQYQENALDFWDQLTNAVPEFVRVRSGKVEAAKYRSDRFNHLLFRPVGLEAAVSAISRANTRDGLELDEAIDRLANVPLRLKKEPWLGLLWSSDGGMKVEGKKTIVVELLLYMMGCRFWSKKSQRRESAVNRLRKRYAGYINREPSEIELPAPITDAV